VSRRSRNRGRPPPKVTVAPASADGPNRQARKEEARRQREALNRKMARAKYVRWGTVALIAVVAVVVGVIIALNQPAKKAAPAGGGPTALQGMQTTPAPWGPGHDGLLQRIKAIGLPYGAAETLAFHIHDHLVVFVDGKRVTVPQYVGINYPAPQKDVFFAVLHTHDDSGIIHIESPVQRDYTLGQFFDVWGVPFTSTSIGSYTNSGNKTVRAFVDGKPVAGDPRSIVLTNHEEIVVTYGTNAQLPKPIPADYSTSLSTSCAPGC
jgi:hypothetical protein